MGRRKKLLTPEQTNQLEALAAFLPLDQIADFFGISDDTLRRRMQEDPEILRLYQKGRSRAHASIGGTILQQARAGNLTAAIFYAKTQMRWSETRTINANVTNGDITIDLVNDDDSTPPNEPTG